MKTNLKVLITNVMTADIKADLSSVALFKDALAHYKDSKDSKSVLSGLKDVVAEVAEELKATKAFQSRCVNVITIAEKCHDFKLHVLDAKTHLSSAKLYFYNINKAISLLDYLREHKTDEVVNKVKNALNKVKKVADKRVYNDSYADKLQELYKEYKMVLSDEGIVKVEMNEEGLKAFVAGLDEGQKALLIGILTSPQVDTKEASEASEVA